MLRALRLAHPCTLLLGVAMLALHLGAAAAASGSASADAAAPPRQRLAEEKAAVEIVAVTAAQAELALTAYRRFGRGNHPAKLNYGDCFAYALAQETGEPLLFKGDDFGQTDIAAA